MRHRGDSVTRRVVGGLGANAYNQFVVLVVQLAGIPILLHYWGAHLYGEWLILFAIPSYLAMTDLGFSVSAGNDMTASAARGDPQRALAVFQSLSALVCLASVAGMIIAALLLSMLPVTGWMHLSLLGGNAVRWILWLFASEVLVKLVEGAVHAGFRASGEYPFYFTCFSSTLLVQQASVWVVAALGYGPVQAAAAFAGIRWLVTPSLASLMFHRHRWLRPGFRHASLGELRRLFRPATANLAVPLSQAVTIQGMVLVVGGILGPVAVVVFAALRTLSRLPRRLAMGVGQALEPELAAAWGKQDMRLVRKLYLRGLSGSFWLSALMAVLLFFAGGWILAQWTQGRVAMNAALFDWLLLVAMMEVLWSGSLLMLRSANIHMRASLWYVISALAGVGLAVLLLYTVGRLSDAGLALLVANASMAWYLSRAAGRTVGLSAPGLLLRILDPLPLLKIFVRA